MTDQEKQKLANDLQELMKKFNDTKAANSVEHGGMKLIRTFKYKKNGSL